MAQGHVDGVIAAEAAAGGGELRPGGAIANEGRNFEREVGIEGVLTVKTVGGRNGPVVPGFLIDRIDADDLEFAAIDFGREGGDHAAILIFPEAAAGSRKDKHGKSAMSEREQLHLAVQRRAMPLHVVSLHSTPWYTFRHEIAASCDGNFLRHLGAG